VFNASIFTANNSSIKLHQTKTNKCKKVAFLRLNKSIQKKKEDYGSDDNDEL
jgi:hypothetical protein